MKGDNLNFWQRYAKLYGPLMAVTGKDFYRSLCEDITKDFSGCENVLELACGSGQLSFMLARRCTSLIATEGFRPFVKLISLFGFKAFKKWTREELVDFVQAHGFRVTSCHLVPSGVSPLAEIEAVQNSSKTTIPLPTEARK